MCLKELFQCIQFRKKCLSANGFFKSQEFCQEILVEEELWEAEEIEDTSIHYEHPSENNYELIEDVVEVADEYIVEKIDECDDNFVTSTIEKSVEHDIAIADSSDMKQQNSKCRFCGLMLSRRNRRIEHERLHILEETQQFYQCHLCNKSFNQKTGLVPHFKLSHGYQQ